MVPGLAGSFYRLRFSALVETAYTKPQADKLEGSYSAECC
jgi:hypothetical protein